MSGPTRVAVIGATGYAGFELARLLLAAPSYRQTDIFCVRVAGTYAASQNSSRSFADGATRLPHSLGGRRCRKRRRGCFSFDAS